MATERADSFMKGAKLPMCVSKFDGFGSHEFKNRQIYCL
jgi:hypothetical protein